MYVTIVYNNEPTGAIPTELRVKYQAPDNFGPAYGVITWDRPRRSDMQSGSDRILIADAKLNGSSGIEPHVLQGAKLLSLLTSNNAPVEIKSVTFSRQHGTAGFTLDAASKDNPLPRVYSSGMPPEARLVEYFQTKGLFCTGIRHLGAMNAVWFDDDITQDQIDEFLASHPDKTLGIFGSALSSWDGTRKPAFRRAYIFASHDHATVDLSRWMSDDIHGT